MVTHEKVGVRMTCTIELVGGDRAYVSDEDASWLREYSWSVLWSGRRKYAIRRSDGVLMHRAILNAQIEDDVDHRNYDGLDNRRRNIWITGRTQNNLNKEFAYGCKCRYLASGEAHFDTRIQLFGQSIHLGTFRDEDVAYRWYRLNRDRALQNKTLFAFKACHRWSVPQRVEIEWSGLKKVKKEELDVA